jgi:hypothetical protein
VAEENYRKFYKDVFGISPTQFLSMGRRYVLSNYITTDIVGLNSCMLEQRHFAGYGYVSLEQLVEADKNIYWSTANYRTKYRIFTLHHHVIPVTPKEEIKEFDRIYSLTLDAGQLIYKALELGVDIIVHGHMHQPFVSNISRAAKVSSFSPGRSVAVHGTGSAGVSKEHTGDIGKNSYSIYELTEDGVLLKMRSWSDSFEGFEKYWECHFGPDIEGGLRMTKKRVD